MRVLSRGTLRDFWLRFPSAAGPLQQWFAHAQAAAWQTPADVKADFASASILGNSRVVFNIGGNKYRLIVSIWYEGQIIFVKFIGTHEEYDAVDAETVKREQP